VLSLAPVSTAFAQGARAQQASVAHPRVVSLSQVSVAASTQASGNADARPKPSDAAPGADARRTDTQSTTPNATSSSASTTPDRATHVVRAGETLWTICAEVLGDPHAWPRVWALNPTIKNPHWLNPGDEIIVGPLGDAANAKSDTTRALGTTTPQTTTPRAKASDARVAQRVARGAAPISYLLTESYIDETSEQWGEVTGSAEEKTLLGTHDAVYVKGAAGRDLTVGQELTIYRPIRRASGALLVGIQGVLKIERWDSKERIARAIITEASEVVERGAKIGPLSRRIPDVPRVRNDRDLEATILAGARPHQMFGQHHLVFLDKGSEAGLQPGNHLQVIRKGDAWAATLGPGAQGRRLMSENDAPSATESIPVVRDPAGMPEEISADLRVLKVQKDTAVALVVTALREFEPGVRVIARSGR